MANTYTQIYIQFVFAVNRRESLIPREHHDELQKYISGIVRNLEWKLIAINNMPDHLHLFAGMNPSMSISDFMREVKANSSGFINEKSWMETRFEWQRGYGAFSYSRSQIGSVARYIENQERHHTRKTFREEYLDMLDKFQVQYDARYVFDFFDD